MPKISVTLNRGKRMEFDLEYGDYFVNRGKGWEYVPFTRERLHSPQDFPQVKQSLIDDLINRGVYLEKVTTKKGWIFYLYKQPPKNIDTIIT